MTNEAIVFFIPLHHLGNFSGRFSSILFIWKKIRQQMLGWVYVKKIDLFWVFLNLFRGKMVDYFYIFSSLHDIHGQGLLQKKNRALYLIRILKYVAPKIIFFFFTLGAHCTCRWYLLLYAHHSFLIRGWATYLSLKCAILRHWPTLLPVPRAGWEVPPLHWHACCPPLHRVGSPFGRLNLACFRSTCAQPEIEISTLVSHLTVACAGIIVSIPKLLASDFWSPALCSLGIFLTLTGRLTHFPHCFHCTDPLVTASSRFIAPTTRSSSCQV